MPSTPTQLFRAFNFSSILDLNTLHAALGTLLKYQNMRPKPISEEDSNHDRDILLKTFESRPAEQLENLQTAFADVYHGSITQYVQVSDIFNTLQDYATEYIKQNPDYDMAAEFGFAAAGLALSLNQYTRTELSDTESNLEPDTEE